MKNQYFGDVNDYRKYGLLRVIQRTSGMSIGVCWMLTEGDATGQGENRGFLKEPLKWRHHDSELFDSLQKLDNEGIERTTELARAWNLIPKATYFQSLLTDDAGQRETYMAEAAAALKATDLVFFDPDTGLARKSVSRGRSGSSRYIFWDEVATAYGEGHSIVIYQHFPHEKRPTVVSSLMEQACLNLGAKTVDVLATSNVAFLMAHQPHRPSFRATLRASLSDAWRGEFKWSCLEV
jgi:hypothetical protein